MAADAALISVAQSFPVSCICNTQMTIKNPHAVYGGSPWCDGCNKKTTKNEFTFHCPKKYSDIHKTGFDYCFKCAKQKYQNQNNKLNNELDIIINSKYNKINNININKIINELCSMQTKQLNVLQNINNIMPKNDNNNDNDQKNQNDNSKVLNTLTQSQLQTDIKILQKVINIQNQSILLAKGLLNKHQKLIKSWDKWSKIDVVNWIINVDNGAYKEYKITLTHGINKENVVGNNLQYVDDNFLRRCGVLDIGKRNQLSGAIKNLIAKTSNPGATIHGSNIHITPQNSSNMNDQNEGQ